MTYYIYWCRQESLRRNGIALIPNRRVWNAVLGCSLKNDRMISIRFQGKPFNITVVQVCAQRLMLKCLKLTYLWRPTRPRTNTKKKVLFITGDWNAKVVGSQEITWNNWQVWPWSTKWSRAKANRVLSRKHSGHSKHPFPTTQETALYMDIPRWSIPKSNWLYSFQPKMEKLYLVSKK